MAQTLLRSSILSDGGNPNILKDALSVLLALQEKDILHLNYSQQ